MKVFDGLFAPDFVNHTRAPGMGPGREGLKQLLLAYRAGFPNLKITMGEVMAEKDSVASRYTSTGTHTGPLMGIPPTGRKMTTAGMEIYHFKNGKVAEAWHYGDEHTMFEQLGVKPPM